MQRKRVVHVSMSVTDKNRISASAGETTAGSVYYWCAGKVEEKDGQADGQAGWQGYLSVSQRLEMTHPG